MTKIQMNKTVNKFLPINTKTDFNTFTDKEKLQNSHRQSS